MLPKKKRLSRKEFSHFFSIGKKTHTSKFFIVYSINKTLHTSVVVSKKIEKSAVKRNKIRRQIYDIVRNYQNGKTLTGVYIFVAKPEIQNMKYCEMKGVVEKTIEKIQNN